MCNKLFQIYGCGCSKEVCTTPCPYAIATARPTAATAPAQNQPANPFVDPSSPPDPPMTLVDSAPPSVSPTAVGFPHSAPQQRSALDALPSQRDREHGTPPPATLSPTTPPPPYSPVRPSQPQTQTQAQQQHPSPLAQTFNNHDAPHTPNFCPYFFSRFTPASRYPCLDCYMRPEWAGYRNRWVHDYRVGHPGTKVEDLERLAGVEGIPERVGLVNVVVEMERMGSLRE